MLCTVRLQRLQRVSASIEFKLVLITRSPRSRPPSDLDRLRGDPAQSPVQPRPQCWWRLDIEVNEMAFQASDRYTCRGLPTLFLTCSFHVSIQHSSTTLCFPEDGAPESASI